MTYGEGLYEEGQVEVRGSTNVPISRKTTQTLIFFLLYSKNNNKIMKMKCG